MDLLTVRDVAEILDVTVGRVHQLIKAGRLPVQKLGFMYVIQKSDVERVQVRKNGRPKNPPEK